MENKMFCFQCQETARGTGCIMKGVCGKDAATACSMDLLLFVTRGISAVAETLRKNEIDVDAKVDRFVVDALFSTITNANFDIESIRRRVDKALSLRDSLKDTAAVHGIELPHVDEVTWSGTRDDYDAKAREVGVLHETDEDKRSLKELIVYGLKGMAAYVEHAMRLGHNDTAIHHFMQSALAETAYNRMSVAELTELALKTGEVGVHAMALLDTANTSSYGHPEATTVDIGVRNRPGILISGHDLKDLEMLLEQTEGTGVDVYTRRDAPCTLLSGIQEIRTLRRQLRQCMVEAARGVRIVQRSDTFHDQLHRSAAAQRRLQEPHVHHKLDRIPWLPPHRNRRKRT